MLNMIICALLSSAVSVLLLEVAKLNPWVAGISSLVVFGVCYLLGTRFVMKKVATLMESAQRDVLANRSDKAIATLQGGFKYSSWQFYVKQQVNSQIGTILYLKRDFNEALPYLEKGFVRNWIAMGMLAISYMKKNKTAKMVETFEKATSACKKEALLWALYAFCLEKTGDREKAISILEKALKKGGEDERIRTNIELLKEGKKMKMKGFGDMWYQFHLEKQGAIIKKQTKAMTGRRKMVRR